MALVLCIGDGLGNGCGKKLLGRLAMPGRLPFASTAEELVDDMLDLVRVGPVHCLPSGIVLERRIASAIDQDVDTLREGVSPSKKKKK